MIAPILPGAEGLVAGLKKGFTMGRLFIFFLYRIAFAKQTQS